MSGKLFNYLTEDFANATLAVVRNIDDKPTPHPTESHKMPTTQDWTDPLTTDCRDIETSKLTPLIKQDAPTTVAQQVIFTNQAGTMNTTQGTTLSKFFINKVTFEHLWYKPVLFDVVNGRGIDPTHIANLTFNDAGPGDIIINNKDGIGHPYHLHALSFWIVAEGSGELTMDAYKSVKFNTNNPIRRDTFVVQAESWAVIRIKADIPGVWFLHCHIDWHLSKGFAAVVVVQPDVIRKFHIPKASIELCKHLPPGQNANSTSLSRRESKSGMLRHKPSHKHHDKRFSHDVSELAR